MKRKTLCWTAAALLAAMLSGCGSQTTAEPANLNQTMLIEKSAKEQTAYSFPNSFTGDWTAQEGKLSRMRRSSPNRASFSLLSL